MSAPAAGAEVSAGTQRLRGKLEEQFGTKLLTLINHPEVEDICANADGQVWVQRRGVQAWNECLLSPFTITSIIQATAAWNNAIVNADQPSLEAILPFREARFQGVVPPLVQSACFAIRLRPQRIFTLDDYVTDRVVSASHAAYLKERIEGHANILVAGGTGSGKTTFLNACLAHLALECGGERILTIEDTTELQCSSLDKVSLVATAKHGMRDCLVSALRMRPRRIIVGEVRGPEALDLIRAWNTGHPGGLATVHANDAAGGLEQIETLARLATHAPQQALISKTINAVVFIAQDKTCAAGRRVRQVCEVHGWNDGSYITKEIN